METIVFIKTAIVCFVFAYNTQKRRQIKNDESEYLHVLKYIKNLESVLKEKEEHIMRCITHTAIHLCQQIHGIRIEARFYVKFQDVRVVNASGEKVGFNINRKSKPSCGYRTGINSLYQEERENILIEFHEPTIFKYIDFIELDTPTNGSPIALLTEYNETTVTISKQKHIVCNTMIQ